ncbi:MAG: alpha/beta fold hydrolase [Arcicella sp.]|jgi:predicted alpha/beta superfamily hydrolase|nr:alpha/beta fold hydrolase [Arcicella sp.]
MKKILPFFLHILLIFSTKAQKTPNIGAGRIIRIENFKSKYVTPRNIDIWLPDNYTIKKRYSVLYMHDGQMLFDSTNNWNKQEWGVDETISKLIKEKKIKDCIVVGIWNIPTERFADYFPEKIIKHIPEPTRTEILTKQLRKESSADKYLQFIVSELKPYVDKNYTTKSDAKYTYIMGSSMGGLISAYALCEYPTIFGGAACLSTHSPLVAFELINDKIDKDVASKFRDYLSLHLPKANTKKIYFDYGTATLDSLYEPYQKKIDAIMKARGFDKKHWITLKFQGENHSEKSWQKRLNIPLEFLIKE